MNNSKLSAEKFLKWLICNKKKDELMEIDDDINNVKPVELNMNVGKSFEGIEIDIGDSLMNNFEQKMDALLNSPMMKDLENKAKKGYFEYKGDDFPPRDI